MTKLKHITLVFLLVGILGMFGCSRNVPLSGTVVFSDDGTPVPRGIVILSTPTFVAQGSIQPDGTYTIGSAGAADGLPRGTYAVTVLGVSDVHVTADADGRPNEHRTPLIDPRYENEATSGLQFTADGSTRTFDIRVDRIGGR
jgi:hypothetical protein